MQSNIRKPHRRHLHKPGLKHVFRVTLLSYPRICLLIVEERHKMLWKSAFVKLSVLGIES